MLYLISSCLVKLETRCTVICPPMVSVLCLRGGVIGDKSAPTILGEPGLNPNQHSLYLFLVEICYWIEPFLK